MWVSGRTRARRIRHAWSCWAGFDKKIFLFGTAGFGGSEAYYQKILANVRTAIDASNTVVGEYMCQGRMPQAVRDRYVKMKEMPDAKPNLDGADRELRSGAFPPGSGGSGKTAEDDYRVKASLTCLNGNYPCIQNGTCLHELDICVLEEFMI